ncbi:MAG: Lrp/AsnC family transcriptional regulator [Vicinamibacterales bacterium]
MQPMKLDEIDVKILHHLQREARISNVELANRVGLSPAPCLRRVRALEEAGVIRKYVALLDPRALNLNVTVLVQVSLDRQVAERFQMFEHAIRDRPEVLECDVTTGPSDFLLRVVVKDVAAYEQFQREFLSRIESVSSTNSSFALKQVKYYTELPLTEALTANHASASDDPGTEADLRAQARGTAVAQSSPAAKMGRRR